MIKILHPIHDRKEYSETVLDDALQQLWDIIFKPIWDVLRMKKPARINSITRMISISSLLPCPYNREIDEDKIDSIEKAIKSSGQIKPFVITEVSTDKGKELMITDGHHRYLTLQRMIKKGELPKDTKVPVVMADEEGIDTAKGERQYRINSISDLKNAIRAGRIFYQEGYFYGVFNSVTGKALRNLGASFSSQKKAYKLDINKIPMDMRTDIVIGRGMNQSKTERILKYLEEIKPLKLIVGSGMQAITMFDDLNKQAITTFKVLPENLQIPMELTQQQKDNLADTYQKNLSGYLEDWKTEQIERLREKTQQNAVLGYRADRLAGIVKSEFDVSKNRAKFIARQETSQFISKYRQDRYTNAGIKQYIWSTSKDERVRLDHKVLDHQIFSWDSPPITNRITGERNHPGSDYNCRCLALPVIRLGVV